MSRLSFLCLLVWTHLSWVYLSRAESPSTGSNSSRTTQPSLEQGKVLRRSYFFQEANRQMDYALYVPTSYRPDRPAPLIVLLHGLGSNPFQVIHYQGIIEQAEKRGYIVAAPTGYNVAGWYGSQGAGRDYRISWMLPADSPSNLGALSEKDVLNVLAETNAQLHVDADRTYLVGHSMGGAGTLYLGAKYAPKWAALVALAPARLEENDAALKNLRHTPVMIVQGGADTLVKAEGTRQVVAKLESLDVPVHYDEIKGGDHLFSIANNPRMIADLFDFLGEQRR